MAVVEALPHSGHTPATDYNATKQTEKVPATYYTSYVAVVAPAEERTKSTANGGGGGDGGDGAAPSAFLPQAAAAVAADKGSTQKAQVAGTPDACSASKEYDGEHAKAPQQVQKNTAQDPYP